MPPILPFLPLIGDAIGAAGVGLGISNALSPPSTAKTAAASTIPGSPTTTVESAGGGSSGALPSNSVLGQIVGAKPPSISTPSGLAPGGAGRASAPPASIGGGGDVGTLPWITGAASPAALPAPGTPGAI
jgi:hypothetical protein